MKLTEQEERWLLTAKRLPNGWAAYNFAIQDAIFAKAFHSVEQKQ